MLSIGGYRLRWCPNENRDFSFRLQVPYTEHNPGYHHSMNNKRTGNKEHTGGKGNLKNLLRKLPSVDTLIGKTTDNPDFADVPRAVVIDSIRKSVDELRQAIQADPDGFPEARLAPEAIDKRIGEKIEAAMAENLVSLVNATGVVVHTNLGRSLLAKDAIRHMTSISERYSNLEFDLESGKRGSRYTAVEDILCEISGAEAAMVVNNNAAAVILALDTLARDREVIVSRGELVEIGGSFRIPDIMAKSGGILREVGTTNRTHPGDYAQAINENTGLLLKVHTSNYAIVGFSASVSLAQLVDMGKTRGLPVMEDLGSGTFVDFSRYGLMKEPTVQESVRAGADVVTFSGDKLLGGPQGGLLVGSRAVMDRIKKNPLTRAFRIDKLTLAALESTLRLYRDEAKAVREIPTLRMLTCSAEEIEQRADALLERIRRIDPQRIMAEPVDSISRAGGGSFPLLEIPTKCVSIRISGMSASRIDRLLRKKSPPVIGRIESERYLLDVRTIADDEIKWIEKAIGRLPGHSNKTNQMESK